MIVLPFKERFIREHFIEFSFRNHKEDRLPDYNLFLKLRSTEQYYLAKNYNWDDGTEILKWIIDDPKCDKGTASLIFWTSEPDFYFGYSSENIPEYERSIFLLLKRIVEKFNKNEFKRAKLKFDPAARIKDVDWSKTNSEWQIPNELKTVTKGFTPISLGMIQNLIWQWRRNMKLAKRRKNKSTQREITAHN